MSLNKDMGDAHEKAVAEKLGMRQSRGSGNQWRDPIDARHNRLDTEYAFAVDGKSTLAKSISVTRAIWEKAVEQAGGERPMLALRFYDDASLSRVGHDLAVCGLDDFAEMRVAADAWSRIRPHLADMYYGRPVSVADGVQAMKDIYRRAESLR
ncbi:hypothetical protein ACFZAM_31500 [Streptomyces sp. NPDC008079]|uniref:hypothetical protein n=1 Tax=Streptomyces sp. NPDC008079 TaxID=3364806 RepID=UPI0036E15990